MMNFKAQKFICWIVVICLFIVILFALIYLITFLSVVVFAPYDLKASFDNPYIDANYSEWKIQSINDFDPIMTPNQWDIAEENNIIYITEAHEIIAIGMVFDDSEDLENDEDYLIALYGKIPNKESITYESYPGRQTTIGYSEYYIANLENSDGEDISYVTAKIYSKALSKTLKLSFRCSEKYDGEVIRSWAEAIVFAHEYTEQKNGKTHIKLITQ